MEYLKSEHLISFKDNKAIVLRDCDQTIDYLSYKDVQDISCQVKEFITRNVKNSHNCIGLEMSHNVYIPSIILSLRTLRHPFIFLTVHDEVCKATLGISHVLTFKSNLNHFDKLLLREKDCLYISEEKLKHEFNFQNIFYVIKTSGTTGSPKFIKVSDSCIESNIKSLSHHFNLSTSDVIYFGTPLTFDPSMIELLLALENGCCLLIVPEVKKINQHFLYETLFLENSITFLQIVPSLFLRWSQDQIASILLNSRLRILAFGGEPFPKEILNYPKPNVKVFNLYGITEVSCWATIQEVFWHESSVPLGCELDETCLEIRGESGEKQSEGEGEIFIGSSTRICFINEEIHHEKYPLYRATGDIGLMKDNKIYYVGRKNDTIKRLGHKINLGKVEERIFQETGLRNKCVWSETNQKLLAFFIIKNLEHKDKVVDKIRVKLLHKLTPEYFPDHFEIISRIPVGSHGKFSSSTLETIYDGNFNNYEELFKTLICKYFGFTSEKLRELPELNFFEIGGNSMLAIQFLREFSEVSKTENSPNLVAHLFERNLTECCDFLRKYNPILKAKENEPPAKKLKCIFHLNICWKYDLGACVDASPLVFHNGVETLVAVGSFSRKFSVIDADSGKQISNFAFGDAVESAAIVSPCFNFIYVGCFDGKLYCLDYKNGKIKWSFTTDDRIKCKPVFCLNNSAIVFGSYDKNVYCIDTLTGNCIWKANTEATIASTPLYDRVNQRIYIGTLSSTCFCLNDASGDVIWVYKTTSPILSNPCFHNNDTIWCSVDGTVHCVSQTGEKIWTYTCAGHLFSSPICDNDWLIFGCHDGNLYFLKCANQEVELVNINGAMSSSACLTKVENRTLIVAATNSGTINLVDLEKKLIVGEIGLDGEIFSSPTVCSGSIYVGCRDNNLYSINVGNK